MGSELLTCVRLVSLKVHLSRRLFIIPAFMMPKIAPPLTSITFLAAGSSGPNFMPGSFCTPMQSAAQSAGDEAAGKNVCVYI